MAPGGFPNNCCDVAIVLSYRAIPFPDMNNLFEIP